MKPKFSDHLKTGLLKILPQHGLAAIMYWLARNRWPPLKNFLIHFVVARFDVDLFEAKNPDAASYACFNDFFTRALRPDARVICAGDEEIACPVDGAISQAGAIQQGRLLQAKDHDYSLLELLANDAALAEHFTNGQFATIYLSPKDYHRIHMPVDGTLMKMIFVPGKLFSVSDATTQIVPDLFAINERTICIFDTAAGSLAMILVGAIFVGSMETVWEGEILASDQGITIWDYAGKPPVVLDKGTEMGRFNMGSTVILLFPDGSMQWDNTVQPGALAQVGEAIGLLTHDPAGS